MEQRSFTMQFAIRTTDTDRRDRLHPDALFAMMQEAAASNADSRGYGKPVLDPRGLIWMLAGISLRMDHFPAYGDDLEITTWAYKIEKLYFHRNFLIKSGGQVIGRANSVWFLVDYQTRRPQRPSVLGKTATDMLVDEPLLPFDTPNFRKAPFDHPDAPVLSLTAEYSDIDRNRHVNNTRYIAWSIDAFYRTHSPDEDWHIVGIDINFINEVPIGGRVDFFTCEAAEGPSHPAGSKTFWVEGSDQHGAALYRAILYYLPAKAA